MSDASSAAAHIAALLYKFETLIDETVTCGAQLAAAMPAARKEANLPALAGQHALGSVGEAITAVIEARRHAVATHKHLDKTRELMGLPEVAFGDETPKTPYKTTGEGHLRVAA